MKSRSSNLTREQKLAMLDALEEKKRRQLDRRASYIPNKGQAPTHKSKKTLRVVFSGNGAGKTAMGVNEALWFCQGYNPVTKETTRVPAKVIVVLDKPEKVESVWLPEIKKWYALKPEQLHKKGKPYFSAISFDNGSELTFMFWEQEAMSFESIELDAAIFDEPCPRHIYIALRRGARKKHSTPRFLMIGTPISAPWLRTDIYEPWAKGELEDTECFRFGTVVNEANLADGYIDTFSRILTEKERRVRLEGEFFDLDGLALAHLFKRDTHLIKQPNWPANWPVVCVIDPAMAKAHVATLVGIAKDDSIVYLKELKVKCAPREFAMRLKEWYAGYRVVDIVCDSLGSSDLSGGEGLLSFIQVLRNNGIQVRATTYDEKQDEAFIQMIQEALVIPYEVNNFGKREPRLKIVDTCSGIISDIETVCWEKVKNEDTYKPKLAISKKDFLACLKYALASRPHFNKGNERVIKATERKVSGASYGSKEKWRSRIRQTSKYRVG